MVSKFLGVGIETESVAAIAIAIVLVLRALAMKKLTYRADIFFIHISLDVSFLVVRESVHTVCHLYPAPRLWADCP